MMHTPQRHVILMISNLVRTGLVAALFLFPLALPAHALPMASATVRPEAARLLPDSTIWHIAAEPMAPRNDKSKPPAPIPASPSTKDLKTKPAGHDKAATSTKEPAKKEATKKEAAKKEAARKETEKKKKSVAQKSPIVKEMVRKEAPKKEVATKETPPQALARHNSVPTVPTDEKPSTNELSKNGSNAQSEPARADSKPPATDTDEIARKEAARLETERKEAARLEAERKEAARLEAERKEAARLETERKEAARLETERKEAARLEAERKEAARLETERKEAARLETERKEKERKEAAAKEVARKDAERKEAARKEKEAERRDAALRDAARKEAERQEAEQKKEARSRDKDAPPLRETARFVERRPNSLRWQDDDAREDDRSTITGVPSLAKPPAGGAKLVPPPILSSYSVRSGGSGFRVSAEGHVITNLHVVANCQAASVGMNGRNEPAGVLAYDQEADLALIKTTPSPHYARFRAGVPPRLGEDVVVAGYPLQNLLKDMNLVKGSISSLSGLYGDANAFQTTAAIMSGNSGGPVFDDAGRVIGVMRAVLDPVAVHQMSGAATQSISFAIKSPVITRFLRKAGVTVPESSNGARLAPAEIGEAAERFVVPVLCWG